MNSTVALIAVINVVMLILGIGFLSRSSQE